MLKGTNIALLIFTACIVFLFSYQIPHHYKDKEIIDYESIVGQSFIVGIDSVKLIEKDRMVLKKIRPGGVVLYSRNIKNTEQLKNLITELQNISIGATGIPMFIMIDEEIYGASRLEIFNQSFVSKYPNWSNIESGIIFLSYLGINVNLSPVIDWIFVEESFIQNRLPPINDINDFISFNESFIRLMQKYNINATLKHFPGAGLLKTDTHNNISIYNDSAYLKESIKLFKQGIDAGAGFIMTNHAIYSKIDSDNMITFSKIAIGDIIRSKLEFDGLVITDDLSDMALIDEKIGLAEAGEKAILAGHNLIMYSHDLIGTVDVFDSIFKKAKANSELRSRIEENYEKIISFKSSRIFSNIEMQ